MTNHLKSSMPERDKDGWPKIIYILDDEDVGYTTVHVEETAGSRKYIRVDYPVGADLVEKMKLKEGENVG